MDYLQQRGAQISLSSREDLPQMTSTADLHQRKLVLSLKGLQRWWCCVSSSSFEVLSQIGKFEEIHNPETSSIHKGVKVRPNTSWITQVIRGWMRCVVTPPNSPNLSPESRLVPLSLRGVTRWINTFLFFKSIKFLLWMRVYEYNEKIVKGY